MSNIKIGWASRNISTDKPVLVPGMAYLRTSNGTHDPITATVMVVEDGDSAIFITVDMVSVGSATLDTVREKVARKDPSVPVGNIIINATHTHAGPTRTPHFADMETVDGKWKAVHELEVASSDEYIEFMTDAISDAVCEAWQGRKEGGIAYGYGYAVVAFSRRVCYFEDTSKLKKADITDTFYSMNGTAIMYGKTDRPDFSHYEAGADHFINIVYTFDKDGKLTGAVINVPCPSQNSGHEWRLSADYWNEVRENIRRKYGDIYILAQCAAAGDLSPKILHYIQANARRLRLKFGETQEIEEYNMRRDSAERIAAAFDEVLSWAKKDIRTSMPIQHHSERMLLPRLRISEEMYEYCRQALELVDQKTFVKTDDKIEDFKYNTRLVAERNRLLKAIQRYKEQDEKPELPAEIHVIGMGDIAFATTNHELYMDFQHRIQARSPYEQTLIVQLCGQPADCANNAGYLCTERALEGRGYSAIPFSCNISPEGGQIYVNRVVEILKKMHE